MPPARVDPDREPFAEHGHRKLCQRFIIHGDRAQDHTVHAESPVKFHIRKGADPAADLHAQAGLLQHPAHLFAVYRLFLLRAVQIDHMQPVAAGGGEPARGLQYIVGNLCCRRIVAAHKAYARAVNHIYRREQDHIAILQKFRSIVSPTSPLFSGWNWQPNTWPRPTAAGTVSPYSVSASTHALSVSARYECTK